MFLGTLTSWNLFRSNLASAANSIITTTDMVLKRAEDVEKQVRVLEVSVSHELVLPGLPALEFQCERDSILGIGLWTAAKQISVSEGSRSAPAQSGGSLCVCAQQFWRKLVSTRTD